MTEIRRSPCLPIILKCKLANAGIHTFSENTPWIFVIPPSFCHFNLIPCIIGRQGKLLYSVIQLSFCHSNIIPSIIGRQGELLHFVIRLSFCHSKIIHSIIERQGDLLISVIQLSFCHSNIIPCIIGRQGELLHFVIRLSFLWNDWTGGRMTELMVDWGTFFNPSIWLPSFLGHSVILSHLEMIMKWLICHSIVILNENDLGMTFFSFWNVGGMTGLRVDWG